VQRIIGGDNNAFRFSYFFNLRLALCSDHKHSQKLVIKEYSRMCKRDFPSTAIRKFTTYSSELTTLRKDCAISVAIFRK
jgi:hypothetical protein